MTDNKIIEALECHAHNTHNTGRNFNCCDCDYIQFPNCSQRMSCDALELINRQKAEIKEWQSAFINEERIKVVKTRAIKEFTEELTFEIVNKPSEFNAVQGTVDFLNGMTHRQHEILDIIKGLTNEHFKSVSSCQQNTPCNLGDTVYCVNGYGSQRYIEEFTVAEIRITKDGIWLTDTKGMEWLARVCHFSRESAERELKAQKGLIDIVNENFDEEVIHITYESDKTP